MSVYVAGALPQSLHVGGKRVATLVRGGAVVWRSEPVNRLATAPADVPRVETRWPGGVETRGLLVEPASSNVRFPSRDLPDSNTYRDAVGVDRQPGTAFRVVDASASARISARADVTIPADTVRRTWSWLVQKRAPELPIAQFRVDHNGGSGGGRLWLNLDTGTGEASTAAAIGNPTHGVRDVGDWWLVWVSVANGGSDTSTRLWIFPAVSPDVESNADNELTGEVTIDGLQLEEGVSVPSSRVETVGATAARAADVASMALAAGEVELTWLDATDTFRSATVQHGGGTFALPAPEPRVYTSVTLDGAEQLEPDDLSSVELARATAGTYIVRR